MVFRPIDLYVITSTFLRFLTFFFNIQKRDFLRFFAVFHTFSRTMVSGSIRLVRIFAEVLYRKEASNDSGVAR